MKQLENGRNPKTPSRQKKEQDPHDDGEHFEIHILGILRMKCRRVTVNVIIVIIILILALLFAWFISKR